MPKIAFSIMCLLVLLACGCVGQSINPYCGDEARIIPPPDVRGRWLLMGAPGNAGHTDAPLVNKPWDVTPDSIVTYDDKDVEGRLEARFFRVGELTYVDVTAADPQERENDYWKCTISPVHILCLVEWERNQLYFRLMGEEFIKKAQDGKVDLPVLTQDVKATGRPFLFTATTGQWQEFLKKSGADVSGIFAPREKGFCFKRITE